MGAGLFVFLLGLAVGSFLNVCIERLPKGESIISPPSRCASCGHRLGVLDLVPVVSYFLLRGRCRYCGAFFSFQYPAVEAATGLLFVLSWMRFGYSWELLAAWVLVSALIVVAVVDLKHMVVPDEVVLFSLPVGAVLVSLQSTQDLLWGLAAGAGAALLLALVIVISRGGMGWGDVKLAGVLGLFLGVGGTLVSLFVAFVVGALVGVLLILARKKGLKEPIPFGPFLSIGGLVALFWGNQVVSWYLKLLVPR